MIGALFADESTCYLFFALLSFAWGASIGSFLNVCIYRIPLEESVVAPRSHCPHCEELIPWYYNIPLFSYLQLGAKCRFCGKPISIRYWLVELLVAILFLVVWLKFGFVDESRPLGLVPITDWKLVPVYWLIVMGLTLGTFVDLEHYILPNRVTLGGIVCGLLLSPFVPTLHGETTMVGGLLASLIGVAAGWGSLWGVAILGKLIFRKDAMGFGDVKLMGAIGACLGWEAVVFTIATSSFLGSAVGISLIVAGKKKMQSRIPFGPYLALAALIWILWGSAWWEAYLRLIFGAR